MYKEKNDTLCSLNQARAQHLLCKHLLQLQLSTLLQHRGEEGVLREQGQPHPLHSQCCSPWLDPASLVWVFCQNQLFSLCHCLWDCVQWWGFAGREEKILFQLGCLCANVSFRAAWDKSSLHWNAQPEVVVSVSTVLRWCPLKIQTGVLFCICQCFTDSSVWAGNPFQLGKWTFCDLSPSLI